MFKKFFSKNKKKDLFFHKTEDGQDLFYPWGYPGESFIISKKYKKNIKLLYKILLSLFAIVGCLLVVFEYYDILNIFSTSGILIVFMMANYLFYIISIYIFTKKLKSFKSVKTKKFRNFSGILVLLLPVVAYFLEYVFNEIEDLPIWFHAISMSYIIFISIFIYKLQRSNGYILTNKEI